jgi:hypothetical protein
MLVWGDATRQIYGVCGQFSVASVIAGRVPLLLLLVLSGSGLGSG